MKKYFQICFLFLACFLQLGHSLFPHNHIEEHYHDGNYLHHHDNVLDENEFSLFFLHFNHTSDVFSNNHLEEVVKVVTEVGSIIFVLNNSSCYSNLLVFHSKKEVLVCEEPSFIISPHLYSLQFRGPPAFI